MKGILVLLAVLVIAVGGWLVLSPKASAPTSQNATTTPPSTTQTTSSGTTRTMTTKPKSFLSGRGTLNLLLTQKLNVKCSVTVIAKNSRTGTMYISNTTARIDFPNASTIDDGTYLSVWSGGSGYKLSAVSGASGSVAASHGGVDPAQTTLDYDCNQATLANSLFTLPVTVQFKDGAGNPI